MNKELLDMLKDSFDRKCKDAVINIAISRQASREGFIEIEKYVKKLHM